MGGIKREVVMPLFEKWKSEGGGVGKGGGVRFCVDEETQRKRDLVERVCAEEGWEVEWGCKGVEELIRRNGGRGGKGEEERGLEEEVRTWLGMWGVRRGER